jgi:putative DNA primase/helicase
VACANGLLHVPTRDLFEHDPRLFNLVGLPYSYNPHAPEPARWLKFLDELWPDESAAIDMLGEFFGYVLSGRTDLHKIMLLVGPTRSGKGTIARVLTALVGRANVVGPTLASLGTNFGLSPLLGRHLAVISDARLGDDRDVYRVVERLLSISGEDTLTVDRKYREPWTGQLPTRFMILTNELPNFRDASGAIANRFLVLQLYESWLGRENPRLTHELLRELDGILLWALDGLDRLTNRGSFAELASSRDAVVSIGDLASPVSAFVRDHCKLGPAHEVAVSVLFEAWKAWCARNNHDRAGTVQTFGRDLRAVAPAIRQVRPREEDARPRVYSGIALKVKQH